MRREPRCAGPFPASMRYFLSILAVIITVVCARDRAVASVEHCPAQIREVHSFGSAEPQLYSLDFSANTARVVSGDVTVQTNAGWFTFPFANLHFVPDTAKYKNAYVEFSRTEYLSPVLYVRFPSSVTNIVRLWVSDAGSKGDGAGWEPQGNVACQPRSGVTVPWSINGTNDQGVAVRITPLAVDLSRAPDTGTAIAMASPIRPPDGLDCAHPFTNAAIVHPVVMDDPANARVFFGQDELITLVEVDVSPTGAIDDASILQPSGNKWFDDHALGAARTSTYAAGTSLCRPAAGSYIFRADYTPPPG